VDRIPVYQNSRKYVWDGAEYESREKAGEKKAEYAAAAFEVVEIEENGKFYLHTRRQPTEVKTQS
jgi:hypothetical protein